MKRTGLLCTAVIALVTVSCSKSETPKTQAPEQRPAAIGTGGAASNDVKSDDDFVHDVAIMNMAAIELSKIALSKGVSSDVKSFAQRMVDDHGAAGDKLKSAVSGSQIAWPAQLDDKHRKAVDELAKKQGTDFDRDYAEAMVHGHQDLAARLESRLDLKSVSDWKAAAAGRTQDKAMPEPKVEMGDVGVRPEKSDNSLTMKVNQWAADTYPVTQKHLDTARTLENAAKKRSTN